MSVCIGITSYNCLPYLVNNIESINRLSGSVKVIINDNCSTDGTQKWLTDNCSSSSNFVYSLNSFNGYASYGCHQSIDYFLTQTDCEYFLHLDPDCEFRSSSVLDEAIEQLNRDPNIGVIGEKRFSLRYQHPKSRSLKIFDDYIMSGSWSLGVKGIRLTKDEMEKVIIEKHPSEDYLIYKELCGNVMFFKRKVIETIGNIDMRRFKMWRWDSEYSMRCLLFGYKLESAKVVEEKKLHHFGGRSRTSCDPEKYWRDVRKHLSISDEDLRRFECLRQQ